MGVAGGGAPPAVVVLEHRPASRGRPKIALLGKGVTLDTGGYNLKTTPQMHRFTDDKAGAAAVIGAMVALARMKVDAHVLGVAPLVENVVSRAAYKPGDVLTAMDGTTVFVESTDAEGRLVLADCLTWLRRHDPDVVIDIATLTGAAANALGEPFAAVYGNDDELLADVRAAGQRSGELVWPMPIHPLHEEALVHPRAMIRNFSEYAGGASSAAAFLRRFVGFPWVHVDMAGRGSYAYDQVEMGPGATGWGTSLLVEAVEMITARRTKAT
jgi:leucyl aminopeptidase